MSRSRAALHVPAGLLGLLGLLAGVGCGDNSNPASPADDHRIEFPGEVADLQQAIDLAAAGDTVEVQLGAIPAIVSPITIPLGKTGLVLRGATAPGFGSAPEAELEFAIDGLRDDAITVAATNVTIRHLEVSGTMRHGVVFDAAGGEIRDCVIRGVMSYAVSCPGVFSDTRIRGNVLVDAGVFGVFCSAGADPDIEENTISGAGDCGIFVSTTANASCRRNIIVGSENWGIACGATLDLECNVLWENVNADYQPGCTPGATDLQVDPRFCDPEEFSLRADSPCLSGNNQGCGDIGAVQDVCGELRD